MSVLLRLLSLAVFNKSLRRLLAPRPCVCQLLSCVQLFGTPWTVAHQAPLSMGFPRQEYWSGLPFPSPGYLLNPGIEPVSPALQADSLLSEPAEKPIKMNIYRNMNHHR